MGGTHESQTDAGDESDQTAKSDPSSSRSHTTAAEFLQRVTAKRDDTDGPSASPGPDSSGPNTRPEYEQYYGVDIDKPAQVDTLQRLEETNGIAQVRRWADEGIPIDAMGTPSEMEAYRQRKDTPVPWDAERQNEQSRRRSELVQRVESGKPAGDTGVPDSVRDVISSPGQSLDSAVQREMEDRMGDSFSDVQVHTGPKAAQACDDINAKAFTVGNNIAFNHGEYDPESAEGQHVLAHELAHVRQQTGGAVSMLPQEDVQLGIDPDPQLEQAAEETAQRVMAGGKLGIQRLESTTVHVQRMEEGSNASDGSELIDTPAGIPKNGYPENAVDSQVVIPANKEHFKNANRDEPHIDDNADLKRIVKNADEVYTNTRGLFVWVNNNNGVFEIVNGFNQARKAKAPNERITISTAYERHTNPRDFVDRLVSSKKLTQIHD